MEFLDKLLRAKGGQPLAALVSVLAGRFPDAHPRRVSDKNNTVLRVYLDVYYSFSAHIVHDVRITLSKFPGAHKHMIVVNNNKTILTFKRSTHVRIDVHYIIYTCIFIRSYTYPCVTIQSILCTHVGVYANYTVEKDGRA